MFEHMLYEFGILCNPACNIQLIAHRPNPMTWYLIVSFTYLVLRMAVEASGPPQQGRGVAYDKDTWKMIAVSLASFSSWTDVRTDATDG